MDKGFTITEVIFGIAIGMIIISGAYSVATKTIKFYGDEETRQYSADEANRWIRFLKHRTDKSEHLNFSSRCPKHFSAKSDAKNCLSVHDHNGQTVMSLQSGCRPEKNGGADPQSWAKFYKAKWSKCFRRCAKGLVPFIRITDPQRKRAYTFPTKPSKLSGASFCFETFGVGPNKKKARISLASISRTQGGLQKAESEIYLGGTDTSADIDWID